MDKIKILDFLMDNINSENLIKCVFSDTKNYEFNKIIIKIIKIKDKNKIQIESFKDNKVFHSNLDFSSQELSKKVEEYIDNFKQILLQTTGVDFIFNKKNNIFSKKEKKNNLKSEVKSHNKVKKYFLNEGENIDFLIMLGLMSEDGKIFKNSYNKFKQINKYLEFIDETIEELKSKNLIKNSLNVLDFGCGKSYLTFALYYYLRKFRQDFTFNIIGLDLKKDVIDFCNDLVKKLNYDNIKFINMDIKDFNGEEVDLVFSLHACNNATDYSLLKALELNSKAILAVPCFHHEFYDKISKNKNSPFYENLKIMGENGIILEKFATLATDSFRSLALELCGYKVKMVEFIDMEHTPKNILIKAIKSNPSKTYLKEKTEEYNNFKNFFNIEPMLEDLLKIYYKKS